MKYIMVGIVLFDVILIAYAAWLVFSAYRMDNQGVAELLKSKARI
jgi:hypothetical protein